MPAGQSRYKYERSLAVRTTNGGGTLAKKANTWTRTAPAESGQGFASGTALKGSPQPAVIPGTANDSTPEQPAGSFGKQRLDLPDTDEIKGPAPLLPKGQAGLQTGVNNAQSLARQKEGKGFDAGRLVHKGRHKLVRRNSGSSGSILSAVARTVAAINSPRTLKASKRWTRSIQAGSVSPVAAPRQPALTASNLQIRPQPAKSAGAATGKSAFKWSRIEAASRPVAIKKPLGRPMGPKSSRAVSRVRGPALRKHLTKPGTAKAKPAKLVRIGGTLYRVSGAGRGQSLKRQETLKPVVKQTPAGKAVRYQRQGHSLRRLTIGSPAGHASASLPNTLQRLRRSSLSRRKSFKLASQNVAPKAKTAAPGVVSRIRQLTKFVNKLCYPFCRTGKCNARAEGRCPLIHDPQKVAVCPKWLKGRCEDPSCTLQHQHKPQLMPLCKHFAEGTCRDLHCPYLHVLLDERTPVCKDFAKGYCPKGASCIKRHLGPKQLSTIKASKTLLKPSNAEESKAPPPKKRRRWPLPLSELAEALGKEEGFP